MELTLVSVPNVRPGDLVLSPAYSRFLRLQDLRFAIQRLFHRRKHPCSLLFKRRTIHYNNIEDVEADCPVKVVIF